MMRQFKITTAIMAMGLAIGNLACQKEIAPLGEASKGNFDIQAKDAHNFTFTSKTNGPNISRWRIPNLGKSYEGNQVSVYFGSAGTYDVILYSTSKGGTDSVVQKIDIKDNDPALYQKQSAIVVSGWYNDGWNQTSHNIYLNNSTLFSEVNPYWYNLGTNVSAPGNAVANGQIYERNVYNATMITQVRSKGDLVIPTIGDMDRGQLNKILDNQSYSDALISNLVNKAVARNYDGWDLNFEHAIETHKDEFSAFVKKLGAALKLKGKILDVTVGGMVDAQHESWWIFDYDGLNIPEVRYIKIMAYDQYLGGTPTLNPVSEYSWVENIVKYAINTRHVPANKLILGIANYGWSFKETAAGMQIIRPHSTYQDYMATPGFQSWYQAWCDELYGEWYVNGVYHAAFFNNAESVDKRMKLVNTYGLAGVCYWVLGKEDPAIYSQKIPATFPGTR